MFFSCTYVTFFVRTTVTIWEKVNAKGKWKTSRYKETRHIDIWIFSNLQEKIFWFFYSPSGNDFFWGCRNFKNLICCKWSNFNMSIWQCVMNWKLLVGYVTLLASKNLWGSGVRFSSVQSIVLSEGRVNGCFQWWSSYWYMKSKQFARESCPLSCTYVTLLFVCTYVTLWVKNSFVVNDLI